MIATAPADVALVGGGLSAALIALRLRQTRPALRVVVLERGAAVGGDHCWSCFDADLDAAQRIWIDPVAVARWPGYAVRFPGHARRIETGYRSLTNASLHATLAPLLGQDLWLQAEAAQIEAEGVILTDGRRLAAHAVIDARGPSPSPDLALGFQKFVGLELETAAPHGLTEPVIMDAAVPQLDGYRFLYLLPFTPTRLLVEDTRYADGAALDQAQVARDAGAYAEARGWGGAREVRREHGVLPVALAGDIQAFWRRADAQSPAARVGLRAALFHPTTGYSLPDAARTADRIAALPEITTAAVAALTRAESIAAWNARGFYRWLNRLLFRAAEPDQRYKVLERFHRLPTPLIERFYAARSTPLDKLRILSGRPPVPLSAAFRRMFDSDRLAEAA